MTLSARAAAVRGDDFQYTLGWYHACNALTDSGILSVSIEDAGAGAGSFDDIVVRRSNGQHLFQQAKNSNYSDVAVTEKWLLTATGAGKSPLQHYFDTWTQLRDDGSPSFELITTRGLDQTDPLLKLRGVNSTSLLPQAAAGGPSSAAGQARERWADALGISPEEFLDFLADFRLVTTGNETHWRDLTKPLMRLAGLRSDDEAVRVGVDLVREWVKTGAGPRTTAHIRDAVGAANLLARDGQVVLAIHAIDRPGTRNLPTLTLDWVDRFDGDSDRTRRVLHDPAGWVGITQELTKAEKALGEFGVRRVLVEGAMRLGLWFAVGAAFPETRRWQLETDQRGELWSSASAAMQDSHGATLLGDALSVNCASTDLAVVVALTHDSRVDVAAYVTANGLAGSVLTVTSQTGPGRDSIRDGAHARNWARSARELIRSQIRELETRPGRLHLFLAAPGGAVLLLGHDWNLLPETLVYEHTGTSYVPSTTVG